MFLNKWIIMDTVIQKTTRKDQKIASEALSRLTATTLSTLKGDVVQISIQKGDEVDIPKAAIDLLFTIVSNMAEGRSVTLVPSGEEISTQQAADVLNVSRPHVVKLLEQGDIPYKKTASHRKILLKDVMMYDAKLRRQRNKSLKLLAEQAQDLKFGYE
jgi:excisionase family DNA binding protein